jgi:hypothetical protein
MGSIGREKSNREGKNAGRDVTRFHAGYMGGRVVGFELFQRQRSLNSDFLIRDLRDEFATERMVTTVPR